MKKEEGTRQHEEKPKEQDRQTDTNNRVKNKENKEIIGVHKTHEGAVTRAKLHGEELDEPLKPQQVKNLLSESSTLSTGRTYNYSIEEYELNQ